MLLSCYIVRFLWTLNEVVTQATGHALLLGGILCSIGMKQSVAIALLISGCPAFSYGLNSSINAHTTQLATCTGVSTAGCQAA